MENFADRLAAACREKKSVTCVGLDPRLDIFEFAPETTIEEKTEKVFGFCAGIVASVADIVPAVKPNIAFFEAMGAVGVACYSALCSYAKQQGLLVIGDVKRGDIGSTAEAYASGLLGEAEYQSSLANHDAITLNAYLGSDGIKPFVKQAGTSGQGAFLLVKTSNPSSSELQDLELKEGLTVAEKMAGLVAGWGEELIGESGWSSVGAVVGATHGQQLARFRELMPRSPFLLPGYGAQGAGADDIVGAFAPGGLGGVVNASRSIIFAYQKENTDDFRAAARRAAEAMNADLKAALERAGKGF